MPQLTANSENFDASWNAFDASGSSTDFGHSTWSPYAAPPDAAPSTSMAGLDGASSSPTYFDQTWSLYATPPNLYTTPPDAAPSTSMACLDGASGSSTYFDHPTWSSYATPPDAAPSTSMAGLGGASSSSTYFDQTWSLYATPPDSYTTPPDAAPSTFMAGLNWASSSSTYFDHPTWSSYATPLDAAPSTSMAGVDASCVSSNEYPFSQPHQLEPLDFSSFPQPSDVSQEPLYSLDATCSNLQDQQCLERILASTAGEGSQGLTQPLDPGQLMATPFLPQAPLTTPSIGLSTVPTSDTGLGSSAILMEPYWKGGLAHPQRSEENRYNNAYLSDDNTGHVSLLPMHPCLSQDHQVPLLSSDHHDAIVYLAGQMAVPNQGHETAGNQGRETAGILAGVLNQPYGADPSVANNNSHDSDTAWHSRSVPHAGTVALEQLDGSSAGIQKSRPTTAAWTTTRSHSILPPSIPPPPTSPHLSTPLDIILTADRVCSYVGPDGKACRRSMESVSNRNAARHWFTCHAMKELNSVRAKKMAMSQARIINSTARQLAAERYLAICPLETCVDKGKPKAEFVREDSLI